MHSGAADGALRARREFCPGPGARQRKRHDRVALAKAAPDGQQRVGLPPFADVNRTVLSQLLDPNQGMPFAARAVIRTQLQLPPETVSSTALPDESTPTNLPEAVDTNTVNSVVK